MMVQIVIAISLFLFSGYAALIIYYGISWRKMPLLPPSTFNIQPPDFKPFISIIIPARNEATNIVQCLDSILKNDFPKECYEVLVIDDFSTDSTAELVSNYHSKNIKLISLKENTDGSALNSYKKKAIEIGISKAAGELIITTDADCIVPVKWLVTIAGFYQQSNASLMVMPVKFIGENSFLNIFQSLDFMTLQGITAASVYKKVHSMCNGANLAYTKQAFEKVGGFAGIDGIASGDDMLLMHKIALTYTNGICYIHSKDVIVQTQAAVSWKAFFNQRIRWASKADKYEDKRIFMVLLLVYFLNLWLVILPLISFCRNFQTSFFNLQLSSFWLLLLLMKTLVELYFLVPVAKFFSRSSLLVYFPFAQPFHICYTVIAGWLGKFGSYEWKGRQVK